MLSILVHDVQASTPSHPHVGWSYNASHEAGHLVDSVGLSQAIDPGVAWSHSASHDAGILLQCRFLESSSCVLERSWFDELVIYNGVRE
jgi:hypothetical protein